ncbi:MarR family winged helix-turn-helix transcriptional regulator [Streptomyces sp. NPDC048825]|uniref:MarR family winged helix-turn-helix transcriptional regulator n=1 Tax=Streptomyces sp. NPDC048825 TaxID=3365592 RepID=UPI00371A6081
MCGAPPHHPLRVELARRLRLQKSTVSRLVGQPTARGRVERAPAPDDGRGVVLRLTASGQESGQPAGAPEAPPTAAARLAGIR